jgi:endonuclease V-like protein UPF0215 family
MQTKVRVDGFEATNKIASMVLDSPHYKQLRVVILDGITFAGFNIVDIKRLNAKTELPVIAVTREKPNFSEVREALENLPKSEERWKAVLNAGEVFEVPVRVGRKEKVYMQISGINKEDARKILQLTSTRSNIPEALRVAHIIASGISILQSKF